MPTPIRAFLVDNPALEVASSISTADRNQSTEALDQLIALLPAVVVVAVPPYQQDPFAKSPVYLVVVVPVATGFATATVSLSTPPPEIQELFHFVKNS